MPFKIMTVHRRCVAASRKVIGSAGLLIGAGIVTLGLTSMMILLIADEFKPQDRVEMANFDFNAKPDDIPLVTKRTPPKRPDAIDVPPPPPIVEIPATDQPGEPITRPDAPPIVFDRKIVPITMDIVVVDSDPTPINRVAPVMPVRADRSGHCQLTFDIGPDGRPYNVAASFCSQNHFERPAIRSVEKWIYRPQIRDGLAVTRPGLKTIIRFNLIDENGQPIPE